MGWDSPIPEEYSKRWEAWLKELPKLENLKIKRCFKPPDFGEVVSAELHHFSDASQRGYGVVSYLLLTNAKEIRHCSFVMGKSRLAPLKTITIPCLELLAAVLATKLDKSIKREIDIPINDSVFWTDSTELHCKPRQEIPHVRCKSRVHHSRSIIPITMELRGHEILPSR